MGYEDVIVEFTSPKDAQHKN
jgi:hypothetical protein